MPDREIISYTEMVLREQCQLQRGMNFRSRGGLSGYSVLLMSVRAGAPYKDHWHPLDSAGPFAGHLEYEGHDQPRSNGREPKLLDQTATLPSGRLTENGKFYAAAIAARDGTAPAEAVQVYEKLKDGIWCDCGRFALVDAYIKDEVVCARTGRSRKVFRFLLKPQAPAAGDAEPRGLVVARRIPTEVKVAVFKRDAGRCVICGAADNLHFDHDLPFSKGGSSLNAENVRLLCARHNLQKSDRIE